MPHACSKPNANAGPCCRSLWNNAPSIYACNNSKSISMPKLHELTAAYSHIDALVDDDVLTNEQLLEYVDAIEGALKEKGENIAKLIENLEATADNIKVAETRMAQRRKAIENRANSIRSYLLANMVNSGITKIECEYFKIAVRDSPPSVLI